jgi:hypothetical protein
MGHLGRRAFLALVGLLSPLAMSRVRGQRPSTGTASSAGIDIDGFLRVSVRLTGQTALDRTLARTYLTALVSVPGNAALLAEIAHGEVADLNAPQAMLRREIAAAWYTGVYQADGQRRLATHNGALMWNVMGRPAPGTCAGAMGDWSKPPRQARA